MADSAWTNSRAIDANAQRALTEPTVKTGRVWGIHVNMVGRVNWRRIRIMVSSATVRLLTVIVVNSAKEVRPALWKLETDWEREICAIWWNGF